MLIANLVEIADTKNIEGMVRYLQRLPNKEFQAVWFRDCLKRHKELAENKHVTKFSLTDMTSLLS